MTRLGSVKLEKLLKGVVSVTLTGWLALLVVAMVSVGVCECVLVNTDSAWWCRGGEPRLGGYEPIRFIRTR